jgi:uncharacterized 2Fe-2S/4Fe-4S cluster protein (DUF4445 family)
LHWKFARPVSAIIGISCTGMSKPDEAQQRTDIDDDALVVFIPSGHRGRFPRGTAVLQAARALGVDIDSVCGGRGICGRCQIVVGEGDYATFGIHSRSLNLGELAANEIKYNTVKGLAKGARLSCSARLFDDVVIDVPASSQIHRQVVRKRADARAIETDPVVRPCYIELDGLSDATPDEKVKAALRQQWQLEAEIDPAAASQLAGDEENLTVALREQTTVVAVWPGFRERLYGLSVDIGSTTVAATLSDLSGAQVLAEAGMMNPQIRFGEDVMSRISYIMMNPGSQHDLTQAIRRGLNELAQTCADQAGIDISDIVEATVVGNPIMHHLFLGLDAVPLGQAPFPLAQESSVTARADDLDLGLNPGAHVHVLPCIAGHVGADASAMILSEAPHKSEELTLLVDIGTNAEIVLGNRDGLFACSSPTGPAFEGAQISCGQRAAAGAIERVRIDRATLEPRFRVIGSELWSDDPAFEEAVADIGVTGICGSGIIEALAELYLAGAIRTDGRFDEDKAEASTRLRRDGETFSYLLHSGTPDITIVQQDVRNIQLAKAAAYAGARLLMDKMAIDRVDRIVLAGAFGSYIDPKHAMILGLIPDCDLARVSAAGNAAGTGARIALLSGAARTEISDLVRTVTKIETALDPDFQSQFVGAMAIPHERDEFPQLSRAVDLPLSNKPAGGRARRGGRRRQR